MLVTSLHALLLSKCLERGLAALADWGGGISLACDPRSMLWLLTAHASPAELCCKELRACSLQLVLPVLQAGKLPSQCLTVSHPHLVPCMPLLPLRMLCACIMDKYKRACMTIHSQQLLLCMQPAQLECLKMAHIRLPALR